MKITSLLKKENALSLAGCALSLLLAFSFGEKLLVSVVGMILLALSILMLLSTNRKKTKTEKKALYLYAGPLLLFIVVISLGVFSLNSYADAFSGIVSGLLSLMGLAGSFLFGLAAREDGKLSPWFFVYSLLGGLALLVLVSWLSTMILYGPWHTLIYSGKQYYINGVAYPIDEEVVFLLGTKMTRVSLMYAGGFSTVLAASGAGLMFVDFREEKEKGIFLSAVAAIGILFIVTVPLIEALIVTVLVYLVALGLRFARFKEEAPKWLIIVSAAVVGLVVLALAVYFAIILSNQTSLFSTGLLRKIFNNGRWTKPINDIISATFYHDGIPSFLSLLFGMNPYYQSGSSFFYNSSLWSGTAWINTDLKTFEIVSFMEGGLVGLLSFLIVLFSTVVLLYRRAHDEKRSPFAMSVAMILFSYFVYMTFFMDMTPYITKGESQTYVSPFGGNALFAVILVLMGLSYRPIYFRKAIEAEGGEND